jgi:uracil-DNA glycosylase family 4
MHSLPVVKEEILACRRCELRGEDEPVPGLGPETASVMVVGDGPTGDEGLLGRPFEERSGLLLKKVMLMAGLPHEQTYMTLLVRCGGKPSAPCVNQCKGWLWQEMRAMRPKVVVTLGRLSTTVLSRSKTVKLDEFVGRFVPLDYLPGTVLAPWYSASLLVQRGKAFESKWVEFFRSVKEQAHALAA